MNPPGGILSRYEEKQKQVLPGGGFPPWSHAFKFVALRDDKNPRELVKEAQESTR
jgi:hypothetical protein